MKTKIFCDIAELKVIQKFNKKKIVKGFTTNPSLMRKAGAKDYKKYSDRVISVLSAPNLLAKALAYYRCTFQESLQLERINQKSLELNKSKIQAPCLYFHGKNDGCIN